MSSRGPDYWAVKARIGKSVMQSVAAMVELAETAGYRETGAALRRAAEALASEMQSDLEAMYVERAREGS